MYSLAIPYLVSLGKTLVTDFQIILPNHHYVKLPFLLVSSIVIDSLASTLTATVLKLLSSVTE
jgi:hypothetical protein